MPLVGRVEHGGPVAERHGIPLDSTVSHAAALGVSIWPRFPRWRSL